MSSEQHQAGGSGAGSMQDTAYVEWVTSLDTEPPLRGAFNAGWRAREADLKAARDELDATIEHGRLALSLEREFAEKQTADLAQARARLAAQERVVEAARGVIDGWDDNLPTQEEINVLRAALDAADAAGETAQA